MLIESIFLVMASFLLMNTDLLSLRVSTALTQSKGGITISATSIFTNGNYKLTLTSQRRKENGYNSLLIFIHTKQQPADSSLQPEEQEINQTFIIPKSCKVIYLYLNDGENETMLGGMEVH